jgi:hypothetical protein
VTDPPDVERGPGEGPVQNVAHVPQHDHDEADRSGRPITVDAILADLDGVALPGGCGLPDECAAHHVVLGDVDGRWAVVVFHEDQCEARS